MNNYPDNDVLKVSYVALAIILTYLVALALIHHFFH
jgi:hypothetical protein